MPKISEPEFGDHLFEYRYNNATWCFAIRAANAQDAKERLKALAWAQYQGEVVEVIPYAPGVGVALSIVAGFRNLLRKTFARG